MREIAASNDSELQRRLLAVEVRVGDLPSPGPVAPEAAKSEDGRRDVRPSTAPRSPTRRAAATVLAAVARRRCRRTRAPVAHLGEVEHQLVRLAEPLLEERPPSVPRIAASSHGLASGL
jgi:hypothetical protein